MCTKLEASTNYITIKTNVNAIELLKAIKAITFKFETQKYVYHSVEKYKIVEYDSIKLSRIISTILNTSNVVLAKA